jgi:hypothetical protein
MLVSTVTWNVFSAKKPAIDSAHLLADGCDEWSDEVLQVQRIRSGQHEIEDFHAELGREIQKSEWRACVALALLRFDLLLGAAVFGFLGKPLLAILMVCAIHLSKFFGVAPPLVR